MKYRVSQQDWDTRTDIIAETVRDLDELPPFILQYVSGELILADGNHRYGALRKLGWEDCWAFIWYDSQEELAEHLART